MNNQLWRLHLHQKTDTCTSLLDSKLALEGTDPSDSDFGCVNAIAGDNILSSIAPGFSGKIPVFLNPPVMLFGVNALG